MLKLWSAFCTIVVSAGFLYPLLFAIHPPSRLWPVLPLVAHDYPKKGAAAILLLMGDSEDRAPTAARLWKEKYAPKIILVESERNDLVRLGLKPAYGQMTFNYLLKLGVPRSAIVFDEEREASSTSEEARFLLEELKGLAGENRRVILVTSWYHSSRAKWIFARLNAEDWVLQSYPSPTPENWYAKESDFLALYNEYLKWPYYVVRYGIF